MTSAGTLGFCCPTLMITRLCLDWRLTSVSDTVMIIHITYFKQPSVGGGGGDGWGAY